MADPVSVRCPHCKARLKLAVRKLAGKTSNCPRCHKPFVVRIDHDKRVHMDRAVDAPSLPAEFPAESYTTRSRRRRKESWAVAAWVGGVSLAGIVALLGFLWATDDSAENAARTVASAKEPIVNQQRESRSTAEQAAAADERRFAGPSRHPEERPVGGATEGSLAHSVTSERVDDAETENEPETSNPSDSVIVTADAENTTARTPDADARGHEPSSGGGTTAGTLKIVPNDGSTESPAAESPPAENEVAIDEPQEYLEAQGVRVLGQGLMLAGETKLTLALREAAKLSSSLRASERALANSNGKVDEIDKRVAELTARAVQLNSQLANVGPNDVILNNRLVGALNSLEGQMKLLDQQREKLLEQVDSARAKVAQAREAYIERILTAGKLAEALENDYEQKAADAAVQQAIVRLNESRDDSRRLDLAPSGAFQRNLRQLESLAKTVQLDAVPLRRGQGDSLYVSAVFNGEHTREMVLDSGASLVTLPHQMAVASGLEPSETSPEIILELADGARITARKITIGSVRVGQFTVKNVDAAVLGPEATNAPPLLGMSVLGQFTFEVDAGSEKLTLTRVETAADVASERE